MLFHELNVAFTVSLKQPKWPSRSLC